jgi:DNA-binding transcriptional ArsR family regulator
MSATTLSDHCEVSQPTVYRRLEELRECDLLEERTRPDPEGGHHRTLDATNVRYVTVELEDGRLKLSIDRLEDMADRFTRLIEGGPDTAVGGLAARVGRRLRPGD